MYKKLIFIAAAAMFMSSCTNDDFSEWNEKTDGPGITFGATATDAGKGSRGGSASKSCLTLRGDKSADTLSVTVEQSDFFVDDSRVSRGAPTTDNIFSSFQVFAFYYKDNTVTNPTLFFKEIATKDDAGRWNTNPLYYWPTTDESGLAFFAVSPEINANSSSTNGLSFGSAEDPSGVDQAVISYLAPSAVENQPDLMVASAAKMNNKDTGAAVPMAFSHILSQVRFKVGTEMQDGTIKSITVTNVRKQGYYSQAAKSWTLDQDGSDDFQDYTVEFNQETSSSSQEGTMIGNSIQTLMMLPQTLSEQSELVVQFQKKGADTPVPLKASIAGQEWPMNGSTVYNINIKPDYTLDFVEASLPEGAQDCHYLHFPIKVNAANLEGKSWTITSDQPWCTVRDQLHGPEEEGYWVISPTGYPSGATTAEKAAYDSFKHGTSFTFSEEGETQLYIFMEENINDARTATLTLSVDGVPVSSTTVSQSAPLTSGNLYMENLEEESPLTWGFNWDRKVVYAPKGLWGTLLYGIMKYFGDENSHFQGVEYGGFLDFKITIDYTKMAPSSSLNETDGRGNTYTLYTNAGGNAVGLDSRLENYVTQGLFEKTSESGDNGLTDLNYAALTCIKKNAFNVVCKSQSQGSSTEVFSEVSVSLDDIKWYLPASGQTSAFPATGDYWTSTPVTTDRTKAYYMIDGNTLGEGARKDTHLVRAVRTR